MSIAGVWRLDSFAGTILERRFELEADRLVLRIPPIGVGGSTISSELRWHRVG